MNKKGKIIGLSLVAIMVVSLFAVAIPSITANGGKPDLIITRIWVDGDRVHYTIKNMGDAAAPTSYTSLWVDDKYGARDRVNPLAPGEESDEVFAREKYEGGEIVVCADYQDRIDEHNEENNCRGGLPDLVIIGKYEAVDADTCEFMVHFTVCNVGEGDADASVACVYIDGWVDEVEVPALGIGECSDELTSGPYECTPCEILTIGVEADNYDVVDECNEENNLLENEFHCPGPDLVITYKYETPNPSDCTFTVTFTVNNIGSCMAGASKACVYIDDEQVDEVDVGPLAADECSDELTSGPYECTPCEFVTIKVEADNDNAVVECDEDNNLWENEFHCPAPDLIIPNHYGTLNPEDCTFTVTFTVNNIGNCMAGPSTACVYVDGEQVDVQIGGLAASQGTPEITVGPFECTPREILTIGVEADNYDVVEECNEDNNVLVYELHCPGPDLVITYKEETLDPDTGTFTVTYTVNNIGICDAGASVACVYINGVWQDVDVGVGPLAAGECTDPIEVGPFECPLCEDIEVKVCADDYDAVVECDEDNNCMTNTVICPCVPLPDLVITDIWVVDNRIHYTIKNIGGEPAPTSYTGLWVDDKYGARDRVDPLAPEEESDEVFAREKYEGGEIVVCADYQDRIVEIDEDNNCNWWPLEE